MKIGDFLYFAPEIRFTDVDLSGDRLPAQYECRIEGFFLSPAACLLDSGHAFAAGLIIVSAIDALARVCRQENRVGERIRAWLQTEIAGLELPGQADALYQYFRNGLVHEARLKAGAEFSLEQDALVDEGPGIMRINPRLLLAEVQAALRRFVLKLDKDTYARQAFLEQLKAEFIYELQGISGAKPFKKTIRPTRYMRAADGSR